MKFFRKSDVLVVLFIVLIGILTIGIYNYKFKNKPAIAEIYYKSELVKTIDLNTGVDKRFSVPQDEHVIFHLYKDGSIRFEESDCPDKICVKTGKLNTIGQTAACLPNELILKIVSKDKKANQDIDMMVGN